MILEGRRMFRSMRSWELSGLIGCGCDVPNVRDWIGVCESR